MRPARLARLVLDWLGNVALLFWGAWLAVGAIERHNDRDPLVLGMAATEYLPVCLSPDTTLWYVRRLPANVRADSAGDDMP